MFRQPAIYERNRRSGQPVIEVKKKRALRVKTVAERLSCSEPHVYKLISNGELRSHKLGSRQGIRVYENDLEAFVLAREAQAEGTAVGVFDD